MKKLLLIVSLAALTLGVRAVPAKKGMWKNVTLTDGTEVRAQLCGDEHLHFWQTEDGMKLMEQEDGTYTQADMQQLSRRSMARRKSIARKQAMRRVSIGEQTHYTGQKKGIVILMQFKDTKFQSENNQAKYNDILNKENYKSDSFVGSVADYFKAQSGGKFELHFDVVGPYTAENNYSYYGRDSGGEGNDIRPDELIIEAVKAANSEVNFKDYDWDGDNEVDQVFVLYAGKGQADGGSSNTIWPHMSTLSETHNSLTLDGVKIDTYACSNEIDPYGNIEGIGCFCHEFSHCMGFPDFYDTSYGGWFGMSSWDLMDFGSYNGGGFRPAGYSAYEKWMSGWLEPIVLDKEEVIVENLKPISEGGEGYIIYNDGNKNEYYIVENRQQTGWDTKLPGKGLMITHVDFDKTIWEENNPNTKITNQDVQMYAQYGYTIHVNDHQRFTIFRANNSSSKDALSSDLYPYNKKDSLTDTSSPKASLYNKNANGTKLMGKPITKIKQNADKTMSFVFREGLVPDTTQVTPVDTTEVIPVDPIVIKGDTLFYESFDKCTGSGGNDGKWSSTIAQSTANFDNANWEYLAGYGANKCARFGNGTKIGIATTPEFSIDGEATLTFKAAAWDTTSDGTTLKVEATDGFTVTPSQFTMPKGEWGEFTITLNGEGTTQLTFTPMKRFFLDEVLVMKVKKDTIPSDLNGDGTVDITDLSLLLEKAFSTTSTADIEPATDVNGDGLFNIADIITLLNMMNAPAQ